MKPYIHAQLDAKKWGGVPEDYLAINQEFDLSKGSEASNRHRCVHHHSFGCFTMEHMFGINFQALDKLCTKYGLNEEAKQDIINWKNECTRSGTHIKNSDGKLVQVRDIAENHILSDFRYKFIPNLQDYTEHMDLKNWMNGIGEEVPSSYKRLEQVERKTRTINMKPKELID